MPIAIRKILDKYFLPCFYTLCIVGMVIAGICFLNVKQQQKDALLNYEKSLNIQKTNETLKLEINENVNATELTYASSNESVIKVDELGNLISVGEGSAILTVSTKDQKRSQDLIVNVGTAAINAYIKKNPTDNVELVQTKPVDPSLS